MLVLLVYFGLQSVGRSYNPSFFQNASLSSMTRND
ncbi:hypothetical protein NXF25_012620 [Crotalus adamanteus]|uniref:Uncharacterized protein n=1 Tax=Crotalus adamanteus TaxID=8729 RepID=A0AAW1BBH7_CROAD